MKEKTTKVWWIEKQVRSPADRTGQEFTERLRYFSTAKNGYTFHSEYKTLFESEINALDFYNEEFVVTKKNTGMTDFPKIVQGTIDIDYNDVPGDLCY